MSVFPSLVALLLDGDRLLAPDRTVLAELGEDGRWRTPDGAIATELVLAIDPVPLRVHVDEDARRKADQMWLHAALEDLRGLCETHATFTSDDVWARLRMPPRESRMIGVLMGAGQRARLVEATAEHRRSQRGLNHGRPVRVWRSLHAGQQRLDA